MRLAHLISISALILWIASAWPASSAEPGVFNEYAVAADHPAASRAGASILEHGGNAADAAAATMLALGVVSPSSSGLGGGGFALYYRASDRSLTFLDFREMAPAATTPDMFRARPGDTPEQAAQRSQTGGLAVAVPGEPRGVAELVARFGKLSLREVVAPAERLARDGFALSAHVKRSLVMEGPDFLKEPLAKTLFAAGQDSELSKNRALADTLKAIGTGGAAAFYKGPLARQMVRAVKARGGVLTLADLAGYRLEERDPLAAEALGLRWVSAPPPSAGGYTMLSSLAQLERTLPAAGFASEERLHALVESWKGPYLDRQRYLGDPKLVAVPLAELAATARQKQRADLYHPTLAISPARYELPLASEQPATEVASDHGTSHLCVVDAEGNVAAVTTTVNLGFGSGIGVGGFWLNDEMDDFARSVGEANAFGLIGGAANLPAPGKRPVSSMSPTIVLAGDQPVLCIGGSGGSRIITAVEQVALYILKDGLTPAEALAGPRVHHQGVPDVVEYRGLSEAQRESLRARGHNLRENPFLAHVQAIQIRAGQSPRLRAGSDPQKGGEPAGR